jgi:hypothetical protein
MIWIFLEPKFFMLLKGQLGFFLIWVKCDRIQHQVQVLTYLQKGTGYIHNNLLDFSRI